MKKTPGGTGMASIQSTPYGDTMDELAAGILIVVVVLPFFLVYQLALILAGLTNWWIVAGVGLAISGGVTYALSNAQGTP